MINTIVKIVLPMVWASLCLGAAGGSTPLPAHKSPKPSTAAQWKTADDFKKAEPMILRKVKWLSDNPFFPTRKDSAQTVVQWAMHVPYLSIKTNVEYIADFLASVEKYPYTAEVMTMYMFGTLEYIIQHPKAQSDSIEAVKAGFASMINMYAKMKAIRKDAENPVLEEYSRRFANSALEEYIRSTFYDTAEGSEP
jgi:hypothetical protein